MTDLLLDPIAERTRCREKDGLYKSIGRHEFENMRARVVAGPTAFAANACGYVIGPPRNSVADAAADLDRIIDYCAPHAGKPEFPLVLIHAHRVTA